LHEAGLPIVELIDLQPGESMDVREFVLAERRPDHSFDFLDFVVDQLLNPDADPEIEQRRNEFVQLAGASFKLEEIVDLRPEHFVYFPNQRTWKLWVWNNYVREFTPKDIKVQRHSIFDHGFFSTLRNYPKIAENPLHLAALERLKEDIYFAIKFASEQHFFINQTPIECEVLDSPRRG
jgi:hypothetical protein